MSCLIPLLSPQVDSQQPEAVLRAQQFAALVRSSSFLVDCVAKFVERPYNIEMMFLRDVKAYVKRPGGRAACQLYEKYFFAPDRRGDYELNTENEHPLLSNGQRSFATNERGERKWHAVRNAKTILSETTTCQGNNGRADETHFYAAAELFVRDWLASGMTSLLETLATRNSAAILDETKDQTLENAPCSSPNLSEECPQGQGAARQLEGDVIMVKILGKPRNKRPPQNTQRGTYEYRRIEVTGFWRAFSTTTRYKGGILPLPRDHVFSGLTKCKDVFRQTASVNQLYHPIKECRSKLVTGQTYIITGAFALDNKRNKRFYMNPCSVIRRVPSNGRTSAFGQQIQTWLQRNKICPRQRNGFQQPSPRQRRTPRTGGGIVLGSRETQQENE